MDQLRVDKITFVGEQVGPVEQELERKLIACLAPGTGVRDAYLVRVAYSHSPEQSVALCLSGGGERAQQIVGCVGRVFHKMFSNTQSLDVVFLTNVQMAEIGAVARPFYTAH